MNNRSNRGWNQKWLWKLFLSSFASIIVLTPVGIIGYYKFGLVGAIPAVLIYFIYSILKNRYISRKNREMNYEQNKENAITFYRMAYEGEAQKAVDLFIGDEYIQHNPDVANGTQGFIDYFERMKNEYPEKSIEFVRCIAEGDLVALHTHQTWPGNDQYVTMDFFRFDKKGKICEHWDAIQQIPAESANPNTMY